MKHLCFADPLDLRAAPELAAVVVADAALDAVVAGLRARHARLEHELCSLHLDAWDPTLRRARMVIGLARSLQAALGDYRELVTPPEVDDVPIR